MSDGGVGHRIAPEEGFDAPTLRLLERPGAPRAIAALVTGRLFGGPPPGVRV